MSSLSLSPSAEANVQSSTGTTPLHFAFEYGHLDVAKALLDRKGQTPLYISAQKGLLESVLEFTSASKFDESAARDGCLDIVTVLLKHGVKVGAGDGKEMTPLHHTARSGYSSIINELIGHCAGINAVNENGWTPLHFAARKGHSEVAKMLLTRGANADIQDSKKTPLHHIAKNNHLEIVNVHLDGGSDPNAKDKLERTPLHYYATGDCSEIVPLLLASGANPNAQEHVGNTPLHDAATDGRSESVKALIDNGANVNFRNSNRSTPLHCATRDGHLDIVIMLLEFNTDVDVIPLLAECDTCMCTDCRNGQMLLYFALGKFLQSFSERLFDYGIYGKPTPLHITAQNGYLNIVGVLLAHGAGVNVRDGKLETLLHYSAKSGYSEVEVGKMLIMHGASLSIWDESMQMPLDLVPSSVEELLVPQSERHRTMQKYAQLFAFTFFQ